MSSHATAPFAAREGSGAETCPCCGQQLLTQEAVRHVRQSELEFERRVEAAAQARIAELAREHVARLDVEHPEKLERPPAQPDEEKRRAEVDADYAKALDELRRSLRQF